MAADTALDTPVPRPAVRPSSGWRTDIQGLRAVAVGLVIAAHLGLPHLAGGFVGVDVFFVLSGFLITTLLLREADRTGRVSISQFYVRRARRILPAATLVIMAVLAFAALRLPTTQVTDSANDGAWAAFFLANVHFAQAGVDYFNQSGTSLFQHYWSLSVEEQFYLVWPVLALVVAARFGRRWFAVVAGVGAVASLGWSVYLTAHEPAAAYFSTPARAFELAAGALLACWIGASGRTLARPWALASAGLGVVLLAAATLEFTDSTPFPGVDALVPVVGTVALLAAGPATPVGRLLSLPPMRYVGDISYSLYLWHWPLIVLAPHLIPDFDHDLRRRALAVLIAVALAALSHRFVEVPFQARRVRLVSGGLRPLLLWPLGLLLAVGSGWASTAWAGHADQERKDDARAWFA
ncbi:MAG: acyltransferase, partial [Nocardioides sp.]|nr:acyltransferase [Nocardioides sp.]